MAILESISIVNEKDNENHSHCQLALPFIWSSDELHYRPIFCLRIFSMIALWDLGNVAVQWNPEKILTMLNWPSDKTATVKQSLFESSLWLDLDQGLTTEPEVATLLAKETILTVDEVIQCFETVRQSLVDFPRSIELIHDMKAAQIPLYVLSNMSTVNAAYLRQRDYFNLFDGIVISAEEKLIKPDVALFQVVLDRYQIDATEMLFIDDSLPNVQASQSLGMQAVHFKGSDNCYADIRQHFRL